MTKEKSDIRKQLAEYNEKIGRGNNPYKGCSGWNPEGILTLNELIEEREKVGKLARQHALKSALDYYKLPEKSLQYLVFTNWLEGHAFNERFEPLAHLSMI